MEIIPVVAPWPAARCMNKSRSVILAIALLTLTLISDYFFAVYKILLFSFWKLRTKDSFDKYFGFLPKFSAYATMKVLYNKINVDATPAEFKISLSVLSLIPFVNALQLMFLGVNMFLALLGTHFCLRRKMSLTRANKIFTLANTTLLLYCRLEDPLGRTLKMRERRKTSENRDRHGFIAEHHG